MSRHRIDEQRTAEQLLALGARLGAGFRHAAAAGSPGVAATPRQARHRLGKATLYHYPAREPAGGPPLVIVYALVNRPYMLDLEPGRSVIGHLVEAGVDTWLVDWGYADSADQFRNLADYVLDDLGEMIEQVCAQTGQPQVNLLGVCQGGVFSLCHASLRPSRIRNLVTMVTPVDFHTADNRLAGWVRALDVEPMVETLGNVPGALLNFGFLALKPFSLGAGKYLEMIDHAEDAERLATFLRMEKWINDSPDQAGAAFAEFTRTFFVDNGLVTDQAVIGDESVHLAQLSQPLLNIIAERDHLVPPSASAALATLTGSRDYHEHREDAGHIGLFVGKRSSRAVAEVIARWLAAR